MRSEAATTKRSWPIGSGIFLVVVMLLLWLNYGRLQRKLGLSPRDLSSIPLARQISADEMQRIRLGNATVIAATKPTTDRFTAPTVEPKNSSGQSSRLGLSGEQLAASRSESQAKSEVAPVNFEQSVEQLPDSTANQLDSERASRDQTSLPNPEKLPTNFHQKFPDFNQVLPNSSSGPANEFVRQPKSAPAPQPDDLGAPPIGEMVDPPAQTFTVVEPENLKPANQADNRSSFDGANLHPETSIVNLTIIGGETWWTIAQDQYGSGHYFRALYRHNRKRFPDYERIPVGSLVELPDRSELEKLDRELNGDTQDESESSLRPLYLTREGDSLFEIARQQLGQASRYVEIKDLNRPRLPVRIGHLDPLPIGTQLLLPESAAKNPSR